MRARSNSLSRLWKRSMMSGMFVFLHRVALVVKAETVGFHIVEPHVVRAAVVGARENEDSRGHACIRLEHARGMEITACKRLPFDNFLADGLVRLLRSEQYAVRYDGSAASSNFQAFQEQRQEQQLGFLGLTHLQQVGGHDVRVQTPLEGGLAKMRVYFSRSMFWSLRLSRYSM